MSPSMEQNALRSPCTELGMLETRAVARRMGRTACKWGEGVCGVMVYIPLPAKATLMGAMERSAYAWVLRKAMPVHHKCYGEKCLCMMGATMSCACTPWVLQKAIPTHHGCYGEQCLCMIGATESNACALWVLQRAMPVHHGCYREQCLRIMGATESNVCAPWVLWTAMPVQGRCRQQCQPWL